MTFEELMVQLASGGSRLATSLAQLLLEYCRANAARVRADLADIEKSRLFAEHRRRMHRYFDDLGEELFEESDVAEVVATMRVFAEGTSEGLSVRATAEALDEALAPLIVGSFRGQCGSLSTFPLIPYPERSLTVALGVERLSTRPDTVEPPIDRTSRFGLRPAELAGADVTLDWRLEDLLAPLKHTPGLSVGDPGTPLKEMHIERYEVDGRDVFYDVRPRDAPGHRARVVELVELARSQGCRVLVFPELSVDEHTLDVLRRTAERPLVLIAGSRHAPAQARGPGENVAVFFVGSAERSHIKYRPFEFADRDECGDVVRRTEHLASRNTSFTIFMSHAWSFSVLICKDFLSTETQRLLTDLQVRLILVPTFSMETEDFRVGVENLAMHGQALTVIANEPEAGSWFGHPIRGKLAQRSAGEPGRGVLHVLESSGVVRKYLTNG
jgi:hypothetical protein